MMTPDHLRRLLVLANAFKEGDLAVGGTRDDQTRNEARRELLTIRAGDIRAARLVDDEVSAALERTRDRTRDAELDSRTVADLVSSLLGTHGSAWAHAHALAVPSEVVAAVVRVMTDTELSSVARRLFHPMPGAGVTIGAPPHFGSRIQPNSPGDDEDEILFATLEGLVYGCGDVLIGVNPASDDVDTIVRIEQLLEGIVVGLNLPTRYCVLSDIVKQDAAREKARVDVGFQSLAGTSAALKGMVGLDVDGLLDLAHGFDGLYFETGQGSAVTNGAAEGVDMVTLEARAYGVARHLAAQTKRWTIVNDVAGFIGPEVFRTVEQLERACLEDVVMAKLHGLRMGLDVCATFHMGIPPDALQQATARIAARAAPAYLMAVPGNADPMLGYLTTSFREHPRLRRTTNRQITTAMHGRLAALGVPDSARGHADDSGSVPSLYASYARSRGERRHASDLAAEGRHRLLELRDRGFDLGYGAGTDGKAPAAVDTRLQHIYDHARRALYASVDDEVIHAVCAQPLRVRTEAADRDEYLARPSSGERLAGGDIAAVAALYPERRPHVQIVISDGLNANAVNAHLRVLLPRLRRQLADAGCHVGSRDIVVRNGRVRVGYQLGGLVDALVVAHLIGERPGTGLDTLSAYLTYGRDEAERPCWHAGLDHSRTTAICGIHPRGTPPHRAADEIVHVTLHILEQRRSGVSRVPARRP